MTKALYDIRARQWADIIEAFNNRDAGITKRDWCRQNNISSRSLDCWRKKLSENPLQADEGKAPAAETKESSGYYDITEQLQPVLLPEEKANRPHPIPDPQPDAQAVPECMIQAGGYQIYLNGTITERTLHTVLKVIADA